ncbi:unnamed protein product, partial [Polarella glacialis]
MAAGLGAGESEALPAVAGRRTSGSRQSAAGSSPGPSGGSSSSSRPPGPAPRARSSCGKYPERMCPPPLTPATAEAAGLLPPRPPSSGTPRQSVLASSRLRQLRVFCAGSRSRSERGPVEATGPFSQESPREGRSPYAREGRGMAHEREDEDELSDAVAPLRLESPFIGGGFAPMILSQKASEKSVLQINIPLLQSNSVRERSSNDIAAAAEAANITFRKTPEKTNQEAWCGNFKSMTFDEVAQDLKLLRGRPSELKVAASRLEVYSDFTEATESWTATALTEQQRNRMRREREHVVRASRPASPKRVLHGHERVSQLQERWVGNLDDPENDS